MRYAAENEREKNMQSQHRMLSKVIAAVGFSALMVAQLSADEIAVGNYGIAANGMPYAVALEKKFFQQEGANVTGIISSQGGGTSIRNMLSGGVAYGEANPGVTAVAIQQGADLKIVSDNVLTVAEFVWAVKPDSSIKSIKDFKGKKIGYTNPRSTSQALAILLLHAAGYKSEDAELVKTGGFGEGVAALDIGHIDVAPMAEPVWSKFKSKYRGVATASEILPPLDNVVGVTTGVAKHYNLDREVARSAMRSLVASKTQGIPYWGSGQFHLEGMKRMVEVQKMVGAISGDIDLAKMIDTRFLPDDIKTPK
jgi:NitT/TauT family transport system substrate-binding protein